MLEKNLMKKRLPHPNKSSKPVRRGFTLIELMVVIAIVAILSTLGLVVYTKVQEDARVVFTKSNLDSLSKAISNYRIFNDVFPSMGSPCEICVTDNEARAEYMRNNLLATLASTADNGPYIDSAEKFVFDGWRIAIIYGVSINPEDRVLCSYGPNKQWDLGPWNPGSDDICFIMAGSDPNN